MEQHFRSGDHVERIDVRQDSQGHYFTQLDDIKDVFPQATRFRVDGKGILFLLDAQGKRHVPPRIGYYPGKVVEVVIAGGSVGSRNGTSSHPSDSISSVAITTGAPLPNIYGRVPGALMHETQSFSALGQSTERNSSLVPAFLHSLVPAFLHTSASLTQQIAQLKLQLERSTNLQLDTQEVHQKNHMTRLMGTHRAQMEKLEELIQLQAESKARNEETQKMIRQVNDHLVIAHQKVDAILVQNYELHEYPVPRLFIVLPVTEADGPGSLFSSSLPGWVPRFTEKFRLFFLCECGEHSKADSCEHGEQIDNTTHLALHEGYELTRPMVFFERYGPYLLGMLQILKTCLMATAIVAPTVGYLTQGAEQLAGTVRSTAESTVHAVNFSIQFLEARLNMAGSNAESTTSTVIDDNGFKDLRALEGADLRKLDMFLKNKDKDKILGNLYRITTKEGHVKWVCLNHYRSSYREAAMKSFLQVVELNQGQYDPHLRKVAIQLRSAITACEFYTQLERAPAVNEIDVTFLWEFSPLDLKLIVQAVQKSNIRYCAMNLNDHKDRDYNEIFFERCRYDPLLELLSTTKIQSARFAGLSYFGKRTSNFAEGTVCSTLTQFGYADIICQKDQNRLANILRACPLLVALELGVTKTGSVLAPVLTYAIMRLRNLEVLQLFKCKSASGGPIKNFLGVFPKTQKLREPRDQGWIDYGHRKKVGGSTNLTLFKNLVNMAVEMKAVSAQALQCIGYMSLKHISIDCAKEEWVVVHHINFSSLRSLHLGNCSDFNLFPVWQSFPENGGSCQIDTLSFSPMQDLPFAVSQLSQIKLHRLWIFRGPKLTSYSLRWLKSLFRSLNLSQMKVLGYASPSESPIFRKLQGWPKDIPPQLKVYTYGWPPREDICPDEMNHIVTIKDPSHAQRLMDII
ncbi:hypothetical protein BG005_000958 [Podila minutissima]|nr:hypothetical protein BG005_000958 [Podila minutissima]